MGFLVMTNLVKQMSKFPKNKFYGGFIYDVEKGSYDFGTKQLFEKSFKYCSGSGFWLSKVLMLELINEQNNLQFNTYDDLAVGMILGKYAFPLKRFDLTSYIEFNKKRRILKKAINDGHFHIRIKNRRNRKTDLNYMRMFTHILYS